MAQIIDTLETSQSGYMAKTPLELGNLFQRHEQAPSDLVSSEFAGKSLDNTRRGVPAAIQDMRLDRVIAPKPAKKS